MANVHHGAAGSEAYARRVRTATRPAPEIDDLAFTPDALIASRAASRAPRELPRRALAGAVAAWFAMIYALCYVALPAMAAGLGLYTGGILSLPVNTVAFVPLALFTVAMAALVRPAVITSARAPRDPVVSAAVGSLLVWALGHETLAVLQPISQLPVIEAITFTGINVVEAGLFGMMLGSFVRTPAAAFALGAAFQAMFMILFTGWLLP